MQTATAPLLLAPIVARRRGTSDIAQARPAAAAEGIASLRIRDEGAEKPGARRKIVAACLVGAIAIHGALAFVPLNLGGSAAQYGIASGDQIEITLLVENDEPAAAAAEPVAAVEPPAPTIADAAPEFQMSAVDEPSAAAAPVAPPARPVQQARPAATAAPLTAKPFARSGGGSERTVAKANYLRNPPPKYPAESRKLREQGVVLLKVSVTAEGRAADVQLQRSSSFPRLDDAAIRAVRRWEFSPARVGVTPVASAVEVPVRFGLN